MRRVTVLVLLVLQAGGCAKDHSSNDTIRAAIVARDSGPVNQIPDKLLTVTESSAPGDGLAVTFLPPPPHGDSVVARARGVLAAARPGFHEWPPSAYAPVL